MLSTNKQKLVLAVALVAVSFVVLRQQVASNESAGKIRHTTNWQGCDYYGRSLAADGRRVGKAQRYTLTNQIITYTVPLPELVFLRSDSGQILYRLSGASEDKWYRSEVGPIQTPIVQYGRLAGDIVYNFLEGSFTYRKVSGECLETDVIPNPFGPIRFGVSPVTLDDDLSRLLLPYVYYTSRGTLSLSFLDLKTGTVETVYDSKDDFSVAIDVNCEAFGQSVSGRSKVIEDCFKVTTTSQVQIHCLDDKCKHKHRVIENNSSKKDAVVYIRGGPFQSVHRELNHIEQELSGKFRRVYSLEYPYTLHARNKVRGYNFLELTDWIADHMASIQKEEPSLSIVAESFGGALVFGQSDEFFSEIEQVILLNPLISNEFWNRRIEQLSPEFVELNCSLATSCPPNLRTISFYRFSAQCFGEAKVSIYRSEMDHLIESASEEKIKKHSEMCENLLYFTLTGKRHKLSQEDVSALLSREIQTR